MNKHIRRAIIATMAMGALAPAVYAADGTITFMGSVNDTTCTINGGQNDFTVTLPPVSVGALAGGPGSVAGGTSFEIQLTQCTLANGLLGSVSTFFEPGADVNAEGRLSNGSGTAQNVDVQVLTSAMDPINLGAAWGSQGTVSQVLEGAPGSMHATQKFYARYYAIGSGATAPMPGTVNAKVMYTLVYE